MRCGAALVLGVLLSLTAVAPSAGVAQPVAAPSGDGEAAPAQPLAPSDALGRETPQGLVLGLLKAMADEDYARAARYLDLSVIPDSRRDWRGPELARELQALLDQGGSFASNWQLSKDPAGRQDDGLPPEQEQFATVRTLQGTVRLIAERIEAPETGPIWLVSADTVRQVPVLLDHIEVGLLERLLPQSLAGGARFGGVPLVHWAALLVLAGAAYLFAWGFTSVIVLAVHRLWRWTRGERAVRLLDAAVLPFRICLAVWMFAIGVNFLGASVVARQLFGDLAVLVGWASLGWLLWRITDGIGEIISVRRLRRGQLGALSAIRFFRRSAKVIIVALTAMAVLDSLGFDVTAGLAALGIGGIAIAFGAQKTVENLVGGLSVIADQPVRVGDFCQFGQTLGTVEDIGIRSTRIRTLDRTVVTVPNGEFASLPIENYSQRDRFWFHPVLALRYETTPDQIRYLLVELRSLLYAHPRVSPDPARVRFLGLGQDCLKIEIFAYVHARDFDDFLEIQEDLTLRTMDIVAESGASFALPSRTLYMAQDATAAEDKRTAAEARVHEWSEKGELQLPGFHPERISALRATLPYPPEGSAVKAVSAWGSEQPAPAQKPRAEPWSFWHWRDWG